jgi:cytochrome c oxidase assembly protein subunit 15
MGCPDWPTCFGQLIPPTDESQLPSNYHQIYADRGYADTDFNVVKTWTEYLNRLTGVTIGILVLLTTWFSRSYLKSDRAVFYLTLTVLLLILFQGWLGAVVVASDLHPVIITLHMLLALLIVALLIYAITRSQRDAISCLIIEKLPQKFQTILLIAMAFTLMQVIMGTQIREAVDLIANKHHYIERQFWRDDFPMIFYVHRSFSAVILFTNLWLVWKIYSTIKQTLILRSGFCLISLIVAAIIAGVTLDRLGMPATAQPIHLLLATLIFGMQFFIYICLKYSSDRQTSLYS